MIDDFVSNNLSRFNPVESYLPMTDRDDLAVDWKFGLPTPIFLFGVRDNAKARLAALACREYLIRHISFRSVIVHEDFENGLSKKDRSRITNASDKQFTSLADFQANAEEYFQRAA
jgi:pSer/pThr/pTyr-binding forkhead associated (FHA) protein